MPFKLEYELPKEVKDLILATRIEIAKVLSKVKGKTVATKGNIFIDVFSEERGMLKTINVEKTTASFLGDCYTNLVLKREFEVKSTPKERGLSHIPVTKEGRIYIPFHMEDETGFRRTYVAFSDFPYKEWQVELVPNQPRGDQWYVCAACDPGGNLFLTWCGKGWGTNQGVTQIVWAKRRLDGTWLVKNITDKEFNQRWPSIVVDRGGVSHIAWSGEGWGTAVHVPQIVYTSVDPLGRVKKFEIITDRILEQQKPSITMTRRRHIVIVWSGKDWGINRDKFQIIYAHKEEVGGWDIRQLTDKPFDQIDPLCMTNSRDNVIIGWRGKGWGRYAEKYQACFAEIDTIHWTPKRGPRHLTEEEDGVERVIVNECSEKTYVFYSVGEKKYAVRIEGLPLEKKELMTTDGLIRSRGYEPFYVPEFRIADLGFGFSLKKNKICVFGREALCSERKEVITRPIEFQKPVRRIYVFLDRESIEEIEIEILDKEGKTIAKGYPFKDILIPPHKEIVLKFILPEIDKKTRVNLYGYGIMGK